MNRLNYLADAIEQHDHSAKVANEAAALLRAAAAEPVGGMWRTDGISVDAMHANDHNQDLEAARLAVANAKAERDAAERRCAELNSDLFMQINEKQMMAASRDAAIARMAELEKARTAPPEDRAVAAARDERDAALARVAELEKAAPARQWRREYYSDRPFWMNWTDASGRRYVAVQDRPIASYAGFVNLHDDTWCIPHVDGDTRDTLPPLPNSSASVTCSPTPTVAENATVAGPTTRELVARLADEVCNYFEDGSLEGVEFVARLRAIIADARRGGAE